ncbi:MAG: RNA polymerase sigma factor SigJ [Leptospiraceae bacterium]|nr:RNA polymerase sigma factor SigJ [Leptospiraceae bacterium]
MNVIGNSVGRAKGSTSDAPQLQAFLENESLLFSIGYRMMGSAEDARDLVQETYLRFSAEDYASIRNPRAFLVTILTRLAIDAKRSAYEKKRVYPGPWLPEPIIDGFEESLVFADSAGAAFLLLLERLSPLERAVVLLRDVFDYEYFEIAEIVEKKQDYCRKIAERARKRVKQDRVLSSDTGLSESRKQKLLRSFEKACACGDLNTLVQLLAEDVRVLTDGGGRAVAAMREIYGSDRASRFFAGLASKSPGSYSVPIRVGGRLSVILYEPDHSMNGVIQFGFRDDQISEFYAVRNPDKLETIRRRIEGSFWLRWKIALFRMARLRRR